MQSSGKSIFVVDWDDTLFPTSRWEGEKNSLAALEPVVCHMLCELVKRGSTLIVTNSEDGWVDFCIKSSSWSQLETLMGFIPVYSAQSRFASAECTNPSEWKKLAFDSILSTIDSHQIISIGDGPSEREAAVAAASNVSKVSKCIATAKFPSVEQIIKQCQYICDQLDFIVHHPNNLDHTIGWHHVVYDSESPQINRELQILS
jgi:hypothetical protein